MYLSTCARPRTGVIYTNTCGRTYECSHAVREDQCVHIDAVLPSTREVNGGGGEGGEGWEESGMGGAH